MAGKEEIIINALSCLTNTNVGCANPFYSKLDALFTYNTTLIEIHPGLVSRILASYKDDKYWARFHREIEANGNLGNNKALLFFVTKCSCRLDGDSYMLPQPKSSTNPSSKTVFSYFKSSAISSPGFKKANTCQGSSSVEIEDFTLPPLDKTKLLYQVNRIPSNL